MPVPMVFLNPSGVRLKDGTSLALPHDGRFVKNDTLGDPNIAYSSWSTAEGPANTCMMQVQNYLGTRAEMIANQHKEYYWTLPNDLKLFFRYYNVYSYSTSFLVEFSLLDRDNTVLKSHSMSIGGFAITNNEFYACPIVAVDIANYENAYLGIATVTKRNEGGTIYGGANFSYQNNSSGDVMGYMRDYFEELPTPPGPYDPGGNTEPGGGEGDFTLIDDTNPVPGLPSVDLADNGLFTIYNPDAADLVSLGNYLWTGLFDVDNFKKLFNDPMQAIISLGIIPGGALSVSVTDKNLIFGHVDTGVDCKTVTSQWLEVDCGFVEIPEFWGNYLDYNPYTKLRLYLPYIGEIDLNADDVIGPYYNDTTKHIGVIYHIDVITGACVAYITRGEGSGIGARNDVFYTATGNVLMQIPVTGNDFKGAYSALIGIAGAAIAGGTAAAAVKGATAGTIGAGAAVAGTSAAISNVTSEKESVRHSGNMAGTAGLMGIQKPYLYIDRPNQAEPYNQRFYTGYPSLIQHDKIGEVSGFTILYAVRLEGIHATTAELAEIEHMLLEGVIL